MALVKLIYQRDEAARFALHEWGHNGHIPQHNGMEQTRKRNVVMLAAGVHAERCKRDGQRLVFYAKRRQRTMINLQRWRVIPRRSRQRQPQFIHLAGCVGVQRRKPQVCLR